MLLCLLTSSSTGYVVSTASGSTPRHVSIATRGMKAQKDKERELCPTLTKAIEIAEDDAEPKSTNWCWRYVKRALVKSGAVDRYPGTRHAKQAGGELKHFGFEQIQVDDPYEAPVGSVLVYGGNGPGHVEFKTEDGFVSDFKTKKASKRPLQGVWVKFEKPDRIEPEKVMTLAMLEDEVADATPRAKLPRE